MCSQKWLSSNGKWGVGAVEWWIAFMCTWTAPPVPGVVRKRPENSWKLAVMRHKQSNLKITSLAFRINTALLSACTWPAPLELGASGVLGPFNSCQEHITHDRDAGLLCSTVDQRCLGLVESTDGFFSGLQLCCLIFPQAPVCPDVTHVH